MAIKIGAILALDGEKEFKSAIKGVNKDLTLLGSEMKKVTSEFGTNAKSLESLTSKQEVFSRRAEEQAKKIDIIKQALENAKKEYGENSDQVRNWQIQLNNAEADLNKTKNSIADLTKEIDAMGKSFAKSLDAVGEKMKSVGGKMTEFGNSVTKHITAPVLAGVSALAGMAMWGGFKRLTDLDTANKKLLALGYSANDVKVVMGNVSEAVDGTAYSLNEGMTVAVTSMAVGVKQGEELAKYLKVVSNTSALAGTSFSEMGDIFNKVLAKGKVDMQTINQLAGKQIPVIAWLGETYGKTTEEIMAMSSKGLLSADMFFSAMEKHTEGMALAMGDTIQGKLGNLKTAISRIGASFLDAGEDGETAFDGFQTVLDKLLETARDLIPVASEMGVKFSEFLSKVIDKAKDLYQWWNNLSDGQKEFIGKLALIVLAVGPVISVLGFLITAGGILATTIGAIGTALTFLSANPIILIIAGITALVLAITHLWRHNENFRNFIIGQWQDIQNILATVTDAIKSFFTEKIPNAFMKTKEWFQTLPDMIKQIGRDMITGLWDGIRERFEKVRQGITGVVNSIKGIFTNKQGFDTHSPSRWAEDIGRNVTEGLFRGINEKGSFPLKVTSPETSSVGVSQNINVTLTLDGKVLARNIIVPLQNEQIMRGVVLG